jgi:hypothetical protein
MFYKLQININTYTELIWRDSYADRQRTSTKNTRRKQAII